MIGASENQPKENKQESKHPVIQLDMADVYAHLDEREVKLFMALLQSIDAKRRINEFAPHDWPKPSQFEEGVEHGPDLVNCSDCPDADRCKTHIEGVVAIVCKLCGKRVEGDIRAESSVEQEWNRMNATPEIPAGEHVVPCEADPS